MGTLSRHLLALGTMVGAMVGCGPSSGLPGIVPTVSISSPANNSTVNLSAEKKIPVDFTTNYTLKAPGTCAGQANCGHIYLLVDSTNCNAPNMLFNSMVVSSPGMADLGKCATATGMHTITLELHHDDGTVVLNLLNNPVTSQVTITTAQ